MEMIVKEYYVSFQYTAKDSWGIGNSALQLKNPITSIENIRLIEQGIKSKTSYDSVIVINWKIFKRGFISW